MKNTISIVIMSLVMLLLAKYQATAQTFCFTAPESSISEAEFTAAANLSQLEESYMLRIYVHVIRRSNGTGGQSVQEVANALGFLDADFNPHGIYFAWDQSIDYIDNDIHYNSPTTNIYTVNNHADGIDIYLFDDNAAAGGRANGVGESSEFWVSGSYWDPPYGSLVKSHVISHEMGHVLFLWHTHHGTYNEGGNDNPCAELVNGSNAAICGDYVTDTPADPHLFFNVDPNGCTWNSSGTDGNGDDYAPDEAIIMAYTHPECMSYFTALQGQRMREAIATLDHLTSATIDCPVILNIAETITVGDSDIKSAETTITATNIIEPNASATYNAGINVRLQPDFHAQHGALFHAYIGGCVDGENYQGRMESAVENQVLSEQIVDIGQVMTVYPNPTSQTATIAYRVEEESTPVTLAVHDSQGRQVTLLVPGEVKEPGQYQVIFDAQGLPEGLYIYRLQLGAEMHEGKIVLQR